MPNERVFQLEALFNGGSLTQALALIKEILNEHPTHTSSLRAPAVIAGRNGQYAVLVEVMCHMLERSPNHDST